METIETEENSDMPAIDWGPSLETGIDIIDQQHQRWVGIYNALDLARKEGREEEALRKGLGELVEYTQYHFRAEEALMRKASYDEEELSIHAQEHRIFTDQIVMFADRIAAGFTKFTPEVIAYLREWLVTHITATDRGYIRAVKDADLG